MNTKLKQPVNLAVLSDKMTNTDIQNALLHKKDEINKSFDAFVQKSNEFVDTVDKIMVESIDPDPVALEQDLSNLIVLAYTAGSLVAEALSFLSIYQGIYSAPHPSSSSGVSPKVTDKDKEAFSSSHTIFQTNVLQKLKHIEDKINKRISIDQSILKYETVRLGHGV